MANTKQAKKRARQAEVHRQRNVSARTEMRTAVKKVVKALETSNKSQATEAYQSAMPIVDKMVNKGLIHKNKAARYKSRLNERLRNLAG